jgi:hypothetical protein
MLNRSFEPYTGGDETQVQVLQNMAADAVKLRAFEAVQVDGCCLVCGRSPFRPDENILNQLTAPGVVDGGGGNLRFSRRSLFFS